MTQQICPQCAAEASGNFCSTCGADLRIRVCASCDGSIQPGDRFCTTCGAPVEAAAPTPPASSSPRVPANAAAGTGVRDHGRVGAQAAQSKGGGGKMAWWMAGAMFVFLLSVLAYPVLVPQQTRMQNPGPTGGAQSEVQQFQAGQGAQGVDLSAMTPIQAANRLFNRVMGANQQGNTEQVEFFLPMSITAYEQAEPLDADGLYDLSTLYRLAGRTEEAIAASQRILDATPTHLFGLQAAGEAHAQLGDSAQAGEYFQAILDNWDSEQASPRVAYQMRPAMMPMIRRTAEEFLAN